MDYNRILIRTSDPSLNEICTAYLEDSTAEAFEESAEGLLVYSRNQEFNAAYVKDLLKETGLDFSIEDLEPVPHQNWNAVWESNFEPVIINDRLGIRAPFHSPLNKEIELVIEPKMSFGTGHHATTALVSDMMMNMNWEGTKVLDFGAGTGILAILAAKLGATDITAIDNEPWAEENCRENSALNTDVPIRSLLGEKNDIPKEKYNCILANINRHIILDAMDVIKDRCAEKGTVLVSGILNEDEAMITDAFQKSGFCLLQMLRKDNWSALQFLKN